MSAMGNEPPSSKLLFFRPAVLGNVTSRHESQRGLYNFRFLQLLLGQVSRWRDAHYPLKKPAERGEAVKTHREAGVGHGFVCLQQLHRFVDPDGYQVLVGCFAVDGFEKPDKMEFRKISLVGNVAEVDLISVVMINKEFGLNDPPVEIDFWVLFCCHDHVRLLLGPYDEFTDFRVANQRFPCSYLSCSFWRVAKLLFESHAKVLYGRISQRESNIGNGHSGIPEIVTCELQPFFSQISKNAGIV